MKQILSYMIDKIFPYEVNWIKDKSKFAIFENLKNRFIGQFLTNDDNKNGYYFRWEDNVIPKEDIGKHSIDTSINIEQIETEDGNLNPKIDGENNFVTGNSNLVFGNLNAVNGQKISIYGNKNIVNEYNVDNEVYFCSFFEIFGDTSNPSLGQAIDNDDKYIFIIENNLEEIIKPNLKIYSKTYKKFIKEVNIAIKCNFFNIKNDDNYIYITGFYTPEYEGNSATYICNIKKDTFEINKEIVNFNAQDALNDSSKFGASLEIDENYIYVGSPFYLDPITHMPSGKISILNKLDFSIVKEINGENVAFLGQSLAVDDNYIYSGAPAYKYIDTSGTPYTGSVFIFKKSDYSKVNNFYLKDVENFGFNITLDDNNIVVSNYSIDKTLVETAITLNSYRNKYMSSAFKKEDIITSNFPTKIIINDIPDVYSFGDKLYNDKNFYYFTGLDNSYNPILVLYDKNFNFIKTFEDNQPVDFTNFYYGYCKPSSDETYIYEGYPTFYAGENLNGKFFGICKKDLIFTPKIFTLPV